jgi:hypothetical protein
MPTLYRTRYLELEVDELLHLHPQLRLVPSDGPAVVVEGIIAFDAIGPTGVKIEDKYKIKLRMPLDAKNSLPMAWETEGRIPSDFHKLESNSLCLASPIKIRMKLAESPSMAIFVSEFVVPYLYGYSYFEQFGEMPFGELSHGIEGIREHLREMFQCDTATYPEIFLKLASLQKRRANKIACPCLSGRRLGKCHNRIVNQLRKIYERTWFKNEFKRFEVLKDAEEEQFNQVAKLKSLLGMPSTNKRQ